MGYKFILGKISLLSLILMMVGCATPQEVKPPMLINDIRKDIPVSKTERIDLERGDLRQALIRGEKVNSLRMVPIFSSQRPSELSEYKFFEIQPGSVYKLLGLKNGDILVAAQGYIVTEANRFPAYISLMPQVDDPNIEIERGGQTIILRYKFSGE